MLYKNILNKTNKNDKSTQLIKKKTENFKITANLVLMNN